MSLSDDGGKVVRSFEDRDTKKVKFKGGNGEASVDMVVDVVPTSPPSWKDKLLGGASSGSNKRSSDSRGSFARMEVYINLDRLFVSQVLVNREIQRVEYDSLPVI
ncbi:hypothetical protein Goari_016751 [Gossypium aridum]|uniref:Uncharacterized protein n=1 Tax=Gossypium aridum TaxID=34290 RepID=A0A7J8WJP1_GOSAI|nr:hypothetical protein [Gossypium aridum]